MKRIAALTLVAALAATGAAADNTKVEPTVSSQFAGLGFLGGMGTGAAVAVTVITVGLVTYVATELNDNTTTAGTTN